MNNRYLYKAKHIHVLPGNEHLDGTWVTGYLCNEHYIANINGEIKIDPSTICQCTGLKDKNGNLIWENDILVGHLDDMYPENATYTQVIWDKNGFYTKEQNSDDILLMDEFDEKYFEVCGNIFDNPELLESKGCD